MLKELLKRLELNNMGKEIVINPATGKKDWDYTPPKNYYENNDESKEEDNDWDEFDEQNSIPAGDYLDANDTKVAYERMFKAEEEYKRKNKI